MPKRAGDAPDLSGRSVLWLDQGWQPVFIGFCPTKKAWKREMKRMGLKDEPYLATAGRTDTFTMKGKTCIIVSLAEGVEDGVTRIQIAGLLAHEAVHVWQNIQKDIGETAPGVEMEACSVQAIFQNLYRTWFDTRGHLVAADRRSAA